jgi:hypothetical protein
MKFIQETIHNGIMDALEKQLNKFDEAFHTMQFSYNLALVEGVTDDLDPDLDTAMEQLAKRLDAARRGLGLTNKLPPGDSRVLHRRKIMGNLNKIRSLFNFIQKKLEDSAGADDAGQGQPPVQPQQQQQRPVQQPPQRGMA